MCVCVCVYVCVCLRLIIFVAGGTAADNGQIAIACIGKSLFQTSFDRYYIT